MKRFAAFLLRWRLITNGGGVFIGAVLLVLSHPGKRGSSRDGSGSFLLKCSRKVRLAFHKMLDSLYDLSDGGNICSVRDPYL